MFTVYEDNDDDDDNNDYSGDDGTNKRSEKLT